MKTKNLMRTIFAVAAMGVGMGSGLGATNEVSGLLRQGLFEEEANHNLEAAIQAYQAVVTQTDKNHQFAATAIFRLGECYRKEGKTNEANAQYQRILREFPDQTELVKLSREQLGTTAETEQSTTGGWQALAERKQITEIKKLSPEKRRVAVQQQFPNPVLNTLMQKMTETEQQLAEAKSKYGDQHPEVSSKMAVLKSIHQQIDDQVEGIPAGRVKAAPSARAGSVCGTRASPDAVEAKEVERIKAMIKDSPDLINANTGSEPLTHAVGNNQLIVTKFLLDNKADIEGRDTGAQTPLIIAAKNGHAEMVDFLLSRGADVNAVSPYYGGDGALHFAAERGYKSVVETLLAHGARVHIRDNSGQTPLMLVAGKGFKTLAETLLAKGADVNARDNSGKTALFHAVGAGNKAIVEWLLAKGAEVNIKDNEGKSALFAAVVAGNKAIAELLLTGGAEVNATSSEGKPALFAAVDAGNTGMVELLLANRADVNLKAPQGYTALMAAVSGKKLELAKLLLEHGADANAKKDGDPNNPRWTALDAAVSQRDNEMVKLLLKHHADPNATFDLRNNNEQNDTPLMMAVWSGQKEIARMLLAGKADVNLKNSRGETAFYKAFWSNYNQEMATLLLDNKADTEIKYGQGRTALGWIAAGGNKEFAELLLSHGADANARDDAGQTPLHVATHADSQTMVELLLAHGADVNAKDKQGNTPLDLAGRTNPVGGPPGIAARGYAPFSNPRPPNGPVGTAGAPEDIGSLLRQHGAVAEVDIATIRYMRDNKWPLEVVFRKDTATNNEFRLFEFVAKTYDTGMVPSSFDSTHGTRIYQASSNLVFPDFSKLKIFHLAANGRTNVERVDLTKALAEGSCAGNIALKWGDIVEIPEADHKVTERFNGLAESQTEALSKCLTREVEILVKGQATRVTLKPDIYNTQSKPSFGLNRRFNSGPASAAPKAELSDFWLSQVVRSANVILASSDLTRVKVKRVEPGTRKTKEMVFNLEKPESNSDLWLEDGDVIELPEKGSE